MKHRVTWSLWLCWRRLTWLGNSSSFSSLLISFMWLPVVFNFCHPFLSLALLVQCSFHFQLTHLPLDSFPIILPSNVFFIRPSSPSSYPSPYFRCQMVSKKFHFTLCSTSAFFSLSFQQTCSTRHRIHSSASGLFLSANNSIQVCCYIWHSL